MDDSKRSNGTTNTTVGGRVILSILETEFPCFSYSFCNLTIDNPNKRGHSKKNTVLAHILDISMKELTDIAKSQRGKSISKGQKGSIKFMQFASKHASTILHSRFRTTKPQRILYKMLLSIDSNAKLEFPVRFGNIYKSFDIFMPTYNTVVEMHGRIWHDIFAAPATLKTIVETNILNDELKKTIALNLAYKHVIFWDDNTNNWNQQIINIFNKDSISYEIAKNQVYEEDRESTCI
jgi:G:T-mismatch repair DNA endonuclease (very short patch repair protein)